MRPYLVPYTNTDDDAARDLIDRQLRTPSTRVWEALFAEDYAEQTFRVLQIIETSVLSNLTARRADAETWGDLFRSGEMSQQQYSSNIHEWREWKKRAIHFQRCVQARRKEIEPYLKQARTARSRREHDREGEILWHTVANLALAVAEHRATIDPADATTADRMLWTRLGTLRIPFGAGTTLTLSEFVTQIRSKRETVQ